MVIDKNYVTNNPYISIAKSTLGILESDIDFIQWLAEERCCEIEDFENNYVGSAGLCFAETYRKDLKRKMNWFESVLWDFHKKAIEFSKEFEHITHIFESLGRRIEHESRLADELSGRGE